MVVTPISWLHISDFHFRAIGDRFSQDQVCRALLQSIHRVVQDSEAALAFVVVTGDIAFSGEPEEYVEARAFLNELVTTTGINPASFYFVPGNHDVNRRLHELAYHGGQAQIDSAARVDYYLADADRIAPLIDRQAAFWSFVNDFTGEQQRTVTDDRLSYVAKLDLERPTICLLGLNSAWLSGADSEEMKLVIGERQVINAIEAARTLDPHLVIALAHHPVTWLTEWDAASCSMRLLPAVDLYLRGHLHSHQVSLSSTPEAPCIEIAAGASHVTRFYDNSYNIVTIDPSIGSCKIQSYQYRSSSDRFERCDPTFASVVLRGSIPGTRADLAKAIRTAAPEAASFSNFMAGLLMGHISEVPILVDRSVSFMVPSAVSGIVDESTIAPMTAFLGLSNILKLYDSTVSLEMRVADNTQVIGEYAQVMTAMIHEDMSCVSRLKDGQESARTIASPDGTQRWSLSLLRDLRRSGEWGELESFARNLAISSDPAVCREAEAAFAEALMHSDESQKREEAFLIASRLASSENAAEHEILLAAATAEVIGNNEEAARITADALRNGRRSSELIDYARNLRIKSRQ